MTNFYIKNFIPHLLLSSCALSWIVGCESRVTTLADSIETPSQVEEKAILEASISILSNSTQGTQRTCTQNNTFKFLVVQSKNSKILCRDKSALGSGFTLGPVCPGGVEVRSVTTSPTPVVCEELVICGKTATSRKTLSSANSTQDVYELTFDQLPWGCQVNIDYGSAELLQSTETGIVIPSLKDISVTPPECNRCKSAAYTCLACAEDKDAPIIQEIVFEKPKCGQLVTRIIAADVGLGLADQPFSFDGGITWQETDFKIYNTINQVNFTLGQIWVRDRAGNITKSATTLSGRSDPCSCYTAWGSIVPHLGTQNVYKMEQVECKQSCDAQKQVQTCDNGKWSGSTDYKFQICKVKDCPCMSPWGAQVPHGFVGKAYKVAAVTCKDDCQASNFSCDQGVIKGLASADYKYESCNFTVEKCNCEYKGLTILNNQSSSYFAAKSVKCTETCKLGKVTCKDGQLSGDTTYTETSCSPQICKCTTPWGELLSHGEERNVYINSKIACASTVNCSDAANISRIKCADAATNSITNLTNPTVAISTYTASSCLKEVCACSHLGTIFKPTDPPLAVYKIRNARFPNKCELATNMGTVTCGSDFNLKGDINTAIFPYTECKNITTGTGDSESDVGGGEGGGTGGGVGNDKGDGEGFRRRRKGGGGGSGCDVNSPPYFCATTSARQNNYGNFCLLPTESGYDTSLITATDYRQRISPGGWIALYSKKEVACGDKCSNYLGLSQCVIGRMSEKNKFKYLDCVEKCP
jgi:hypothetical protein